MRKAVPTPLGRVCTAIQISELADVTTDGAAPPPDPGAPPNPGDSVNCSDFSTWAEAKAWYDTYYPYYGDVAGLDGDGDGIPCESLSGAP